MTNSFEEHKGKITDNLIIDALKDHDHSICYHSTDSNINYGICWSYLLTIGKDNALVCVGSPCKNEFKEYSLF